MVSVKIRLSGIEQTYFWSRCFILNTRFYDIEQKCFLKGNDCMAWSKNAVCNDMILWHRTKRFSVKTRFCGIKQKCFLSRQDRMKQNSHFSVNMLHAKDIIYFFLYTLYYICMYSPIVKPHLGLILEQLFNVFCDNRN